MWLLARWHDAELPTPADSIAIQDHLSITDDITYVVSMDVEQLARERFDKLNIDYITTSDKDTWTRICDTLKISKLWLIV